MSDARDLPPDARLPLAVYRALSPLAAAILLPGTFLRLRKRGNWRLNFGQRLGFFHEPDALRLKNARWTWIHSISVGETLVALKLAKALISRDSTLRIALSVTTSTGYALACAAQSDSIFPMYNPVDSPGPVERALNLLRPERLILIEGEVWPNLVSECYRRQIPVVLANARLSPRSASRFARAKPWVAPLLNLLEWIGIPDAEDERLWMEAGVSPRRIRLTGSIKFDQAVSHVSRAEWLFGLLRPLGFSELTPIVVAGSTHDGEERILVRALKKWRRRHPGLRLILVPRHIERASAILAELASEDILIARRTALTGAGSPDVILVDSTGELRDWYSLATVVFVGKSLTAEGGQNPVEPALAGKPVVFGPHMENFATIVGHLVNAKAVVQVADEASLESEIESLLSDPARRMSLGAKAVEVLASHQGAADRTARLILGHSA